MSSIEVGEYVRTPEDGYIGKLVEIIDGVHNYYKIDVKREIKRSNGMSDNYIYSRDGLGLKHSKNIIDLIEIGDVVNGEYKVDEFRKIGGEKTILCNTYNLDDSVIILLNKNIKTILTHEQYSQNAYRLEE